MDCSTHKSIPVFTTLLSKNPSQRSQWNVQVPGMRINESRMAQSPLSLLLYFDSALPGAPYQAHACRPLRHGRKTGGLAFQEARLSVLHLCPALPVGGGGLGLREQVRHINVSSIAESMFPTLQPSLLDPIPRPHPIFPLPGGTWVKRPTTEPHPVPLGVPGRKYSAASGTAGAITPYH